jgi:hypothetical protein
MAGGLTWIPEESIDLFLQIPITDEKQDPDQHLSVKLDPDPH